MLSIMPAGDPGGHRLRLLSGIARAATAHTATVRQVAHRILHIDSHFLVTTERVVIRAARRTGTVGGHGSRGGCPV
jgi:hypothetical protein